MRVRQKSYVFLDSKWARVQAYSKNWHWRAQSRPGSANGKYEELGDELGYMLFLILVNKNDILVLTFPMVTDGYLK